jgi:hypothetical protein
VDDTVVCFTSVNWQRVSLPHFWPNEGGIYRFRISACGVQSDGKPVTFEVTGGPNGVDYFDAPADVPTVFEFVAYKPAQSSVGILPYRLGHPNAVKAAGIDKYTGRDSRCSGSRWRAAERDLAAGEPPPDLRRPSPEAVRRSGASGWRRRPRIRSQDADRVVRTFARRAFRRAVTDEDLRRS